jgi:hypothetical protein
VIKLPIEWAPGSEGKTATVWVTTDGAKTWKIIYAVKHPAQAGPFYAPAPGKYGFYATTDPKDKPGVGTKPHFEAEAEKPDPKADPTSLRRP